MRGDFILYENTPASTKDTADMLPCITFSVTYILKVGKSLGPPQQKIFTRESGG